MTQTGISFRGSLFLDRVPAPLQSLIAEHAPGDPLWGAIETGSERDEGPVWFVVTTTFNALCAADAHRGSWTPLPLQAAVTRQVKRTRQMFYADEQELFQASRLGSSDLERLVELAFRPRAQGLHQAALDHIAKKKWSEADDLLELAEAAVNEAQRTPDELGLTLEQQIHYAQAICAMHAEREGDAVVLLAALSDDRPGDDLLRVTEEQHKLSGWLLTLALAHEEAGQPASAARVYQRLYEKQPDEELLLLAAARALRRAGDAEASAGVYQRYLDQHAAEELTLAVQHEELRDFVAACLESGALLEQLGRSGEAAQRYLTLIRSAPFEPGGYARLFSLRESLPARDAASVDVAAEVLHLLNPAAAAQMAGLPPRHVPVALPHTYQSIDQATHDESIVHQGERESSTWAQKWIGILTRDERETRDIERHAQRVDAGSHPEIVALLASVSELVGVKTPRLYLSYGSTGIEVLGTESPFVLLGSCHVDPSDPRFLDARELTFALGSQVEHIRAQHVLLTSSEFWRSFGTRSATTLLSLLPLGSIVSRLTDKSLLRWVGKLSGTKNDAIRSALDLAGRRIEAGATGEGVQTAYTVALAKLRNSVLEQPDQSSLVKERLADFARAARYTADRVGMIAADDVGAAVRAAIRLSPSLHHRVGDLHADGLTGFLNSPDDDPVLAELILRIAELLKFVLSDQYLQLRRDHVAEN